MKIYKRATSSRDFVINGISKGIRISAGFQNIPVIWLRSICCFLLFIDNSCNDFVIICMKSGKLYIESSYVRYQNEICLDAKQKYKWIKSKESEFFSHYNFQTFIVKLKQKLLKQMIEKKTHIYFVRSIRKTHMTQIL